MSHRIPVAARDGEYRWIVCSGAPRWSDEVFAGYIASCVDITDIKRAQEESFDRQKIESLRLLTGGIAHDFNNLLGGILVEAELAEAQMQEGLSPWRASDGYALSDPRGRDRS